MVEPVLSVEGAPKFESVAEVKRPNRPKREIRYVVREGRDRTLVVHRDTRYLTTREVTCIRDNAAARVPQLNQFAVVVVIVVNDAENALRSAFVTSPNPL